MLIAQSMTNLSNTAIIRMDDILVLTGTYWNSFRVICEIRPGKKKGVSSWGLVTSSINSGLVSAIRI